MKRLSIIAALLLSGCATHAVQVPVVVADSGTAIDATYNTAAKLYLAAAPSLPAADKAKVKALFAQMLTVRPDGTCTGYVCLADRAAAAGDNASLAADVLATAGLIAQIKSLLPQP